MKIEMVRAFRDEFEKIAATVSAQQLTNVGSKAAKRGWSGLRENQSIQRLISRDNRGLGAAAERAKLFKSRAEASAGAHTVAIRSPRPAPGVEPTRIRKPMGTNARRTAMGVGAGAVGFGGYELGAHRN